LESCSFGVAIKEQTCFRIVAIFFCSARGKFASQWLPICCENYIRFYDFAELGKLPASNWRFVYWNNFFNLKKKQERLS
jgi:hypothetical protein